MKQHQRKKDTTQQKKMKNMTIIAGDLASTAPMGTFGNHKMRTQKSKELRLTLFQK